MSWVVRALAELLRSGPTPGTPEHREAFLRAIKERNDERAKPPGQRNDARLLELDKRALWFGMNFCKAKKELLRSHRDLYLQRLPEECCADCQLVRNRAAVSCDARAAWNEAWEMISSLRLEALEQGHPLPPLTLPYLELRLPEGMPEELPPSIDRCSDCQERLEDLLQRERSLRVIVDDEP